VPLSEKCVFRAALADRRILQMKDRTIRIRSGWSGWLLCCQGYVPDLNNDEIEQIGHGPFLTIGGPRFHYRDQRR